MCIYERETAQQRQRGTLCVFMNVKLLGRERNIVCIYERETARQRERDMCVFMNVKLLGKDREGHCVYL